MKNRNYVVLALCTLGIGVWLAVNTHFQSHAAEPQALKLEGAWIATVPGMPLRWTYTLSPDPSGKQAALSGAIQVPVQPAVIVPGLFADLEYVSPMIGQVVMSSRDTARFTAVWYGLKKGVPFDQVVFIGVNSGEIKMNSPSQTEVTHHLAFYDPSTDANGDGLPDPGTAPALCLPATSTDIRLPLLAPCTP